MARLAWLLGGTLLLIACTGAPAAAPTNPPASVAPTVAAPPTVTPAATAATAPTDAPSASPPGDTSGSQGEKITVGDYQYITMVDAEYSTDGYSDFFGPDEGNVIYAFLLEFEGIDPAGSSYNPLYFDLEVDGVEYNSALLGGKEPTLSSGSLQPGATIEGWISFDAPLADEILLQYEPVLGLAGNRVEWVVTVEQ